MLFYFRISQLTPKASRLQPVGANVMVYSKNNIPIRKNKPFQPEKLDIHSNESVGAMLLSKKYAKKHEEQKQLELDRLKLYQPKQYEPSENLDFSRKTTRLRFSRKSTVISNSPNRTSSNLKYSLQNETNLLPTPPTIFKRQFTGYRS